LSVSTDDLGVSVDGVEFGTVGSGEWEEVSSYGLQILRVVEKDLDKDRRR
jgi:hypothetical protein